jgi:rubrerythrin
VTVESTRSAAEVDLARVLQLAYSGELAAAFAYRGHWKSVHDTGGRSRIQSIETEELHHRQLVGQMLAAMNVRVRRWPELRAAIIGRVLGALCHVTGELLPLYGAGRLESRNIREYEAAAQHARDCGRHEWIDCLLTMAEVEWEHEAYFRSRVESHWLGRKCGLWPKPAAKEAIRAQFEVEGRPASVAV